MTVSVSEATRGVFVTGTDTGVGKTVASVALIHRLRAAGLRTVGMKPVASGCEHTPDGWRNDDALRLQAASDPQPGYGDVNPYALERATAPQLAACAMGIHVDLSHLNDAYARLAALADAVVVEGVGGWAAPLDDGLDQVDLVRKLDLPVLLVVGLRLGCLNHARLTARALRSDGMRLIGWIGNRVDPAFAECDEYVELLRVALPAPCLGVLQYAESPDAAAMASRLSLPTGFA
ncbi:MAG: dethiobiotin synthase [Lysobacter sp.]|nr:dethiobiotin synthase [Lysobacter sp.]